MKTEQAISSYAALVGAHLSDPRFKKMVDPKSRLGELLNKLKVRI